MSELKEEISEVKDRHAAAIVESNQSEHEERTMMETLFLLGRIKQVGHDARAVYTALSSQEIRALENFQQQGGHKILGYQTIVDFLDKSEYSPMSKHQYYERLKLINEHGDEIYDLLTSVGISVRAQKLLGKGDLAIKGDRLMVGDQEVDVKSSAVVKQVLEELFDERRDHQTEIAKEKAKNEKLTEQIERGRDENEQLQRSIDAMRSGSPYDRSVARTITDMLELTEAIGQLSDKKKASAGEDTMPLIWTAFRRVRAAYGTNFKLEDVTNTTHESDLDQLAAEVLVDDEDLD